MFVTYPWPVPSANVEPPGALGAAVAAPHLPEYMPETSADRPLQVEELVSWTHRERLRLAWYRLRLTSRDICRTPARARESKQRLP